MDGLLFNFLVSGATCTLIFFLFVYLIQVGVIRIDTQPERLKNVLAENARLKDVEDLLKYEQQQRLLLSDQLVTARQEIEALKQQLNELQRIGSDRLAFTPLLLICGDQVFCDQDELQLSRSRVWYRKLDAATKADVEAEIARRRQDRSVYSWAHLSAHGTTKGILLSDGIAEFEWWAKQLEGFEVILAANCESVKVGDYLAGLVDAVVVIYGNRDSNLISRFTYSFWSEMSRSNKVRTAYQHAIKEVPALRPFVDLRVR